MSVNPTVVLTLVLLSLMVGAGFVSGSGGYALGREALRGITQPDGRPNNQIGSTESAAEPLDRENIVFLDEAEIIKAVESRMTGNPSSTPVAESEPAEQPAQTNALSTPEAPASEGVPAEPAYDAVEEIVAEPVADTDVEPAADVAEATNEVSPADYSDSYVDPNPSDAASADAVSDDPFNETLPFTDADSPPSEPLMQ